MRQQISVIVQTCLLVAGIAAAKDAWAAEANVSVPCAKATWLGPSAHADVPAPAPADATFDESAGVTLFAFDDVAIPFLQNLRLQMRSSTRHPTNPVVRRGEPGTPDAWGVQFYGSVIREQGKFRMWYVAFDDDTSNKIAPPRGGGRRMPKARMACTGASRLWGWSRMAETRTTT